MTPLVVTGTDTDVGKTVFAAALTAALGGIYWKPIQSGTDDGTDRMRVAALSGLPPEDLLPERFVLSQPLSPHRSAELDGVEIRIEDLHLPDDLPLGRRLIIEGAGGTLVPVNRQTLLIEVFRRWRLPVIVCARTRLGTINHTLLTVEALRRREIPILGIAFIGDDMPDTERTIVDFAGTRRLGRLPILPRLDRETLVDAFIRNFDVRDFDV
jgi:dethiobiotin synthetase